MAAWKDAVSDADMQATAASADRPSLHRDPAGDRRGTRPASRLVSAVSDGVQTVLRRLIGPRHLTFGLAGQSNMAGRAPFDDLAAFSFPNRHRVRTYTGEKKWLLILDDAAPSEPAESAPRRRDKVGPGLAFGDRLAELLPRSEIRLVPCAKGSTSMDQWSRNSAPTSLYGSMMVRLRAAGPVSGILFYQGESDTEFEADAASWVGKMRRWVEDVRADLDDPDLPIIITVLGPDPLRTRYWPMLVAAQQAMELPERVGRVSANGLAGLVGNEVHLDTPSQIALGRLYAQEMARLLRVR